MQQGTSIYLASHSCDLKDTPNHDFIMPATHAYNVWKELSWEYWYLLMIFWSFFCKLYC